MFKRKKFEYFTPFFHNYMIVPLSRKELCRNQLRFTGRLKSETVPSFYSSSPPVQLFIQAKLKWLICASSPHAPFRGPTPADAKCRRTPSAPVSPKTFIPSPNGREKLLSVAQRCYLLGLCQSEEAALRGEQVKRETMAALSCSHLYHFLEN